MNARDDGGTAGAAAGAPANNNNHARLAPASAYYRTETRDILRRAEDARARADARLARFACFFAPPPRRVFI